jgi:hypothetical protein
MTVLESGTGLSHSPKESIAMANLWWKLRSNPALWRKGTMALVMIGATVAAFYWGRMGGTTVEAQQIQPRVGAAGQAGQGQSDYSRRVVAYLYENMPISREELGEYLIARFGQERIDFLINRRIVEMACQSKGIYVTDLEIETQFKEELKAFPNMTAQDFYNQILKRFNKSLYEWKEDVIRPKLMLSKLCRPMVEVTQQDLVNAFEARYGPKVECRMIAFQKGDKHMKEVWTKISQGEAEFAAYATQQFLENLRATGGKIPPIHKHFGDAKIEEAAFNLKPGQITPLMEMPDSTVVLKCDKHLPADLTKTFDSVRLDLHKEMTEVKLAQKMNEYFAELRKQAHPRVMITSQVRQDDLERQVVRDIVPPRSGAVRPIGN